MDYTTDEDVAEGWTDSDWMHHEKKTGQDKLGEPGGTEMWRFQLNRRLTPAERQKVALRDEEYSVPDEPQYDDERTTDMLLASTDAPRQHKNTFDINKLLAVIRDVAPDVTVVRARIGGQEARTIADWMPEYNHREKMQIHDMDGFADMTPMDLLTYDQFCERATRCTMGPIG